MPLCHSTDPRDYCYAELAISSSEVAETIASTYCTYPQRDGQAEWASVALINTGMVDPAIIPVLTGLNVD